MQNASHFVAGKDAVFLRASGVTAEAFAAFLQTVSGRGNFVNQTFVERVINLCGNIPQKPRPRNRIEFCRHPSTQRQ